MLSLASLPMRILIQMREGEMCIREGTVLHTLVLLVFSVCYIIAPVPQA